MKSILKVIYLSMLAIFIYFGSFIAQEPGQSDMNTKTLIKNITWIENACVKIAGSKTVYFDPYRIKENDKADIILITHDHGDHFSPSDINKIKGENTIIAAPACVTNSYKETCKTVKPGDVFEIKGVKIEVIPSYNVNKPFHSKDKGHVGFIITLDGISYYHPGDADFIPEMKQIKADVAFLPVGGTYMMNAAEAVEAAKAIKPKVAIPFHWGSVIGSKADAEKFKSLYSGITEILERQ
jgi:L-ascorbate metabolism protein UlaG (beta-lactamase superfamily)